MLWFKSAVFRCQISSQCKMQSRKLTPTILIMHYLWCFSTILFNIHDAGTFIIHNVFVLCSMFMMMIEIGAVVLHVRYWVSACAVTWNLDTASWSVAQQQYSVLFNFQENLNKQDLEMQDWLRFDLYVKMEKRLVVRSNGEALQRFRDLELMQTSFISYKNRVSMMLFKLIAKLI